MIVLLALAAFADDCRPITDADWRSSMDGADAALSTADVATAHQLLDDTRTRLGCADTLVGGVTFARFAQQVAILAFLEQDENQAVLWALAAAWSSAGAPWPEYTPGSLKVIIAQADEPPMPVIAGMGFVAPNGGGVFANGRFIGVPAIPAEMPVLLQIADKSGHVVRTAWQGGSVFPPDVLEAGGGAIPVPGWYTPEKVTASTATSDSGPACEPLTEDGFIALAERADAALDDDDILGFGATWSEMQKAMPCLTDPLPKAAWADFLVDLAIVQQATGQPWREPLATALAINPAVERDVGPDEVRNWQPIPPSIGDRPPLPTDAAFYLDGRLITSEPELTGLHLVQKNAEGEWVNRLLSNQPFPADWSGRQAVVPDQPRPSGGGSLSYLVTVGALGGYGSVGQKLDDPGDFLPQVGEGGAVLGIASSGEVAPGAVGFAWNLALPLQLGAEVGAEGQLDARIGAPAVAGLVGIGTWTVAVHTADGTQVVPLWLPHVGVTARVDAGGPELIGALGAGFAPYGVAATGGVGVLLGDGALRFHAGLDGSWARGVFVQDSTARQLGASRFRVGLRAGVAFGHDAG